MTLEKMRKIAKQLQIDVRNFSELKKTKNERRFDVTLEYSITVRDVYHNGWPSVKNRSTKKSLGLIHVAFLCVNARSSVSFRALSDFYG